MNLLKGKIIYKRNSSLSILRNEINLLHKLGIINVPEYWNENAVKGKMVVGEYAAILIKRIAAFLSRK